MRASSAPASVMILNVEPGGCRPEKATPARPRISPDLRAQDRDAAELVAERLDGRALHLRVDRRAHRLAGAAAWPIASMRLAGAQASRRGARRAASSKTRSRPVMPTFASSGTPSARSSSTRSGGAASSWPAIAVATAPSGDVRDSALRQRRAVAGEDVRPRRGRCMRAIQALALLHAGEGQVRRPVDAGVVAVALKRQPQDRLRIAPNARVVTVIGTATTPSSGLPTLPARQARRRSRSRPRGGRSSAERPPAARLARGGGELGRTSPDSRRAPSAATKRSARCCSGGGRLASSSSDDAEDRRRSPRPAPTKISRR